MTQTLLARRAAWIVLAALLLGLAPGVLSGDAPHALRGVAVLALATLLAALGAVAGMQRVASWLPARGARGIALELIGGLVAGNAWLYFGRMPYDSRVWKKFEYTGDRDWRVYSTAAARNTHGRAASGAVQ